MVADVLHYAKGAKDDHTSRGTEALSALVYQKTKGNPFFTISFLTKLHQTGFIVRAPFAPSAPLRSAPLPELLACAHHRPSVGCSGSITRGAVGCGTWRK
jgi:hypothetical protein